MFHSRFHFGCLILENEEYLLHERQLTDLSDQVMALTVRKADAVEPALRSHSVQLATISFKLDSILYFSPSSSSFSFYSATPFSSSTSALLRLHRDLHLDGKIRV